MSRYTFGYLFVRFAKLLAIIVLCAGAFWIWQHYRETQIASERARYFASPHLQQAQQELAKEWQSAVQLVGDFRSLPTSMSLSAKLPDAAPDTDEEFVNMVDSLETLRISRSALKEHVVSEFERNAASLEQKLRAHVDKLAAETAPLVKPAQPKPQPTVERAQMPATIPSLFSPLSRRDWEDRRELLEGTQRFLGALESRAENEDSRKALVAAASEARLFKNLLPAPFDLEPKRARVNSASETTNDPSLPKPEFEAEKVANQLAALRQATREAVLDSWKIDRNFVEVDALTRSERERCRNATLAVRGIWIASSKMIGLVIGAALMLAFFLMVLGDVLQSFFDTAVHTRRLLQLEVSGAPVEEVD